MIYNLLIKLLTITFPRLKLDIFLLPKEVNFKFVKSKIVFIFFKN